MGFVNHYGVEIVTGEFGSGKTYHIYKQAFLKKLRSPDKYIVIANMPYDFVDVFFSSSQDMNSIFDYLVKWSMETNNPGTLSKYNKQKNIIFIIDEAHLYFFSRNFKKNFDESKLILTSQCRKRRIHMFFITQKLGRLDKVFREFAPVVTEYKKTLPLSKTFEFLTSDSTDTKDPHTSELKSNHWHFPIFLSTRFSTKLRPYHSQKYLSYYITGMGDKFSLSYDEFIKKAGLVI